MKPSTKIGKLVFGYSLKAIGSGVGGLAMLAVVFVLGGSLVGCGDSTASLSGWNRLASAEGRFSVEFPKPPETKNIQGRMNDPRFQDAAIFTAEKDGLAFMAAYSDEFDDILAQFTTAQILDAARDGAISNVQGQLLYELSITKNGAIGREIHLRVAGGSGRLRIYLVGKRKYVLGVFGRDGENSTSTRRFLDSFEFTVPSR